MNLINGVIRLLERPKLNLSNSEIPYIQFRIEFAQARKQITMAPMKAEIYGNLVYELLKYYTINDYLIIEGYFSTYNFESEQLIKKKGIKLHIVRLYPFLIKNFNY